MVIVQQNMLFVRFAVAGKAVMYSSGQNATTVEHTMSYFGNAVAISHLISWEGDNEE